MIQWLDVHVMNMGVGSPAWSMRRASTMKLPLLASLLRRSPSSCPKRIISTTCSIPDPDRKKVIVISGPTGSGKSRLALELAKRLDGEIVSADSVQVYRGLDIGSAKPSSSDRKEVPHHLLDILHPSEEYSAGQFFEDARKVCRHILENGRTPIVAGGTGLYLRWFIYGKPEVPKASADVASEVRSELMNLQRNGQWDAAVDLVVKAGDLKAPSLPYNDWYRLRRSLEIIRATGSPPSSFSVPYDSFREHFESRSSDFDANSLGENRTMDLDYDFICMFLSSPRVELYRAIDLRCEEMLMDTEGILSEASWLLDMGLCPNMNSATRAIGYRQSMAYLLGCRREKEANSPENFFAFLSDFQKASRNFAKRQLTWFRNEHIYHWIDASQPLDDVIDFISSAYSDQTEKLMVPKLLGMKKDVNDRKETFELKSYRVKNKVFMKHEDCCHVLDWVRRTQQK